MFRPIWDAHVIDFYQNQNVSDNKIMFGLVSVTFDQVSSILKGEKATVWCYAPKRVYTS